MKISFKLSTIVSLLSVFAFACSTDRDELNDNDRRKPNDSITNQDTKSVSVVSQTSPDSFLLSESLNENDIIVNEYLNDQLNSIRKNFKRINSISVWTSTTTKDLWESTEGGTVTYYYNTGTLEKIITKHFGETGQKLTEYFLLNEQLSFVIEKTLIYPQPISLDSTLTNEVTAIIAGGEIIEDRSYFDKGKLIHQLSNQDCGAPYADDYLAEEKNRLLSSFKKLLSMK